MDATAQPRTARRHAGFTLVELLIGVALGLLIMIALIAVYLNVTRTNSEMAKTNSIIENGRFAIDVLNEDLLHAGYWGGHVPQFENLSYTAVPGDVPATATLALGPCLAYTSWDDVADADYQTYRDFIIGNPVQVYNAVPTGCSAVVTDRKADTDVLVVSHADTCTPGSTNCDAFDAQKVYFQASLCHHEINDMSPKRPYVFTASTTGAGTTTYVAKNRGCAAEVSWPGGTSGTYAPIRKFVSNIYYIRTWANSSGDGIPTLVRASFNKNGATPQYDTTATALIEGIENLKIELGVDAAGRCAGSTNDYARAVDNTIVGGGMVAPATCVYNAATTNANTMPTIRGDGSPETYVWCDATCTAAQLRDVVAARIYILARGREASPGHTDTRTYVLGSNSVTPATADQGYKRQVFQTTVRFMNVSGRRETP